MPINVTMEEPRAGVVSLMRCQLLIILHNQTTYLEPDSDIVTSTANADHVATNRVHIIVSAAAGTANNVKGMLMGASFSTRRVAIVVYLRHANGRGGHHPQHHREG